MEVSWWQSISMSWSICKRPAKWEHFSWIWVFYIYVGYLAVMWTLPYEADLKIYTCICKHRCLHFWMDNFE